MNTPRPTVAQSSQTLQLFGSGKRQPVAKRTGWKSANKSLLRKTTTSTPEMADSNNKSNSIDLGDLIASMEFDLKMHEEQTDHVQEQPFGLGLPAEIFLIEQLIDDLENGRVQRRVHMPHVVQEECLGVDELMERFIYEGQSYCADGGQGLGGHMGEGYHYSDGQMEGYEYTYEHGPAESTTTTTTTTAQSYNHLVLPREDRLEDARQRKEQRQQQIEQVRSNSIALRGAEVIYLQQSTPFYFSLDPTEFQWRQLQRDPGSSFSFNLNLLSFFPL